MESQEFPKGAKSALGKKRNSRLSLGAEVPDTCCLRGQVKAGDPRGRKAQRSRTKQLPSDLSSDLPTGA